MDSNTLSDFRTELYRCFLKSSDALMNTVDALLTECTATSFVELSLSPYFERKWHSLYKAIKNGAVDAEALRRLFAKYAPKTEERRVLAVDASSIPRPASATARDKTYVHAVNLPEGSKPIVAGWQFSALVALPETPSSWTYALDNQRIESDQTQSEVASKQLEALVPLLPEGLLLLADGGYGNAAFMRLTEGIRCDKLCRLAKNRVLYAAPPKRTESPKPGHPEWHGAKFDCKDATTQTAPTATYTGLDATGQEFEVCAFSGLHFRKARSVSLTVLRVTRQGANGTERDPRVSWFVFSGEWLPSLETVPALYARRYSIEHGFRVDKQELLWEEARFRTPEGFQLWTDLVACVCNQLCLSRDLAVSRRGWERKEGVPTPSQTRRAMPGIIRQLGTPARPSRPRGYSRGRQKGTKMTPATRYPTVYKAKDKPKRAEAIV